VGRGLPPTLSRADGVSAAARRSAVGRRSLVARAAAADDSSSAKRISQGEFTEKAWESIVGAPGRAQEQSQQVVETEHLFLVMLEQEGGLTKRYLEKAGVSYSDALEATERFVRQQPTVTGSTSQVLGRNLETLVEGARKLRDKMGDEFVATEHLLLALAQDRRFGEALLRELRVSAEDLERAVNAVRGGNRVVDQGAEDKYEALMRFARDLTAEARAGKLDPVIGRDDEIRRTIQILSRRSKNNPVLIGEPGVGKTAISEGLAQRIVAGDVPASLQNRKVMSLDIGSLIAGAKYRGEFEDRMKGIMKEVVDSDGEIILFIDEIHTVVGAGGGQGAGGVDAGNLLKPALARGELRCIGATTLDEFRKYIEKDPALERRFQQVFVPQPTVEDTISILRGLRERYELHHGVRISDSALVDAAILSDRYVADRFLPDKAIDLVDEAAAKLKMEVTSKPVALDEVDRNVLRLEMERLSLTRPGYEKDKAAPGRLSKLDWELEQLRSQQTELQTQWESEKNKLGAIQSLKEEMDALKVAIEAAERDYDLNRAAELKYGSLIALQRKLEEAEATLEKGHAEGDTMLREEVTEADISEIISKWTGIPVAKLLQSEREKLLHLADELHERVIGQDEAVQAVAEAIQRSRAGLSDPQRPIASFMFLGPTGVGKTELAKTLASFLFNTEEAIVRIDMSEYMEKHSVSRLVGAPPGYVGFEEGGQLTEAVRRRPYAVVLFDEMEKAHSDVFNILLQILDDGRVTDSQGRVVSFRNAIIIMTSNIGSQFLVNPEVGAAAKEQVLGAVRASFRPEFVNRVDEFIVFSPLGLDQIESIVRIQVQRVRDRLTSRKMGLRLTDAAFAHLAAAGYDPAYGARPVKRALQHSLETVLAQGILRGDFGEGSTIVVDAVVDPDTGESRLALAEGEPLAPAPDAATIEAH